MVVYEQIEKLKREYTDKWVSVLDEQSPELSRYHDRFGQVKTVNMNGRALVEFHGGVDTGWIDIDLNYLKVVDKPDFEAMEKEKKAKAKAAPKAKPAAKKPAAKGADGEKLSPLEMARQQGAKKKDGGAKASTADILAAARGKGGATKEEPAKASGGKPSTADILAAARGKDAGGSAPAKEKPAAKETPAAPAKASGGKLSTADILAAARGKGGGAAPAKEEPAKAEPAEEPVAEEPVAEETPAKAPAAKSQKPTGDLPKDVAGMLEYCRKADAN